jgi:hypothetical protein
MSDMLEYPPLANFIVLKYSGRLSSCVITWQIDQVELSAALEVPFHSTTSEAN